MSASNPEPPMHTSGLAGVVDTHCHLFLLEGDPASVVEASRAAGVEGRPSPTSARSASGRIADAKSTKVRSTAAGCPGVTASEAARLRQETPGPVAAPIWTAASRVRLMVAVPRASAAGWPR